MLQTTQEVTDLIASGNIAPFLLVRFGFTEPLLATDFGRDLEHDNETYRADKGLVSVTPPSALSEVSRDIFSLVFKDSDDSLKTVLDRENIGVPIIVTLGLLKMPEKEMTDARLVIYRGRISSASWGIQDDSSLVSIKCTGPLAKLLQVTNRTTTTSSQSKINAIDTCFDYTYATSDEQILNWGGSE